MKNGMISEQLVAPIKRINKTTGECTACQLEYTFGQDMLGTKYISSIGSSTVAV